MEKYEVIYPFDLHDVLHAFEVEAKGWFRVFVSSGARKYEIYVYDPQRLAGDIAGEIELNGLWSEGNVLVIPAVTHDEIEKAIERLARTGFHGLIPSPE